MSILHSEYPNMVEYARKNLKSFQEEPLNEVDFLIFSWLVYLNVHQGTETLKDLLKAEYFEEMLEMVWTPDEMYELIAACAASPRFRGVRISHYRNEVIADINLQFAAAVFSIDENHHVVSFRGTDWTVAGWKEDAMLSLDDPVPAQETALSYMDEVSKGCEGRLYVIGHSKGGNIAVYASSFTSEEVQERIEEIYSFDGPGLQKSELESAGYKKIRERIRKFVPQSSYFGMLFETDIEQKVITSNNIGLLQHNPISWKVEGNQLAGKKKPSVVSSFLNEHIKNWIDTLSEDERRLLIHAMFDTFEELNVEDISEVVENPKKYIPLFVKAERNMDDERKALLKEAVRLLVHGGEEKGEPDEKDN